MKLATALSERADLQRRIISLRHRLNNNAKVQEGEQPAENPEALLKELDGCLIRLEELVARINKTNNAPKSGELTITDMIAKRDILKERIGIMRDFLDASSDKVSRYSKTEIKVCSTVNVAELQKELDSWSKKFRETDDKIQELNWLTELI